MKKIGMYLLAIYVMIVTVGCAVFATLYFVDKFDTDVKNMTYAEAKEVVDKVYKAEVEQGIVSAAANEEDFTDEKIPMPLMQAMYSHAVKYSQAYMQSDLNMNKWYKYTNSSKEKEEYLYATIKGNSVIFHVPMAVKGEEYEQYGTAVHPNDYLGQESFAVTKIDESNWKVEFYQRYYFNTQVPGGSENKVLFTLYKYTVEAKNNKIYHRALDVCTTKLETWKNSITKQDVGAYACVDYNNETKKKSLTVWPEGGVGDLSSLGFKNSNVITENEAFSRVTNLYNKYNSVMLGYFSKDVLKDAESAEIEIAE